MHNIIPFLLKLVYIQAAYAAARTTNFQVSMETFEVNRIEWKKVEEVKLY